VIPISPGDAALPDAGQERSFIPEEGESSRVFSLQKGGTMASGGKERKVRESRETPQTDHDVQFICVARGAKKIFVAGTFNDWNTTSLPMKKGKDGAWKLTIKLPSGTYEYKYLVDGAWAEDVTGSDTVPNYVGTRNRIMNVN
jgi:1,4-alpha-glucan branching enzyme